jgi:hypothetical protein
MDLISLALAALRLFNWITGQIDESKLRADERRRVFQEQMMIANERLGISAQIDKEIDEMSDEDRDAIIGDDGFVD